MISLESAAIILVTAGTSAALLYHLFWNPDLETDEVEEADHSYDDLLDNLSGVYFQTPSFKSLNDDGKKLILGVCLRYEGSEGFEKMSTYKVLVEYFLKNSSGGLSEIEVFALEDDCSALLEEVRESL